MKRFDTSKYLGLRSLLTYSSINYLQAGLGFLITIVLARQLTKVEYGYYTYGFVFVNLVNILASFGMDKSFVRDLIQHKISQKQRMLGSTIFKGLLGILVALIVLAFASSFDGMSDDKLYVVGLSALAGILLAISPQGWYDISGRIHKHAIITLCERVLFFSLVMLLVFKVKGTNIVFFAFVCLVCVKLLFTTIEWCLIRDEFRKIRVKSKVIFANIIKNNKWIWFAATGNLMMGQVNQLILEGSSGMAQLASFGLAYQLIHIVRILQGQILRLSKPFIAKVSVELSTSRIKKELYKSCGYILVVTMFIVVPFYFFAPSMVEYVIGKKFNDAIPIFNLLLIWLLVYGVGLIMNQYLISLHLQKGYFITNVVFGVLSIFLAIYFIDRYQAFGSAIAILIAHSSAIFAQMVIVLVHLNRNEKPGLSIAAG